MNAYATAHQDIYNRATEASFPVLNAWLADRPLDPHTPDGMLVHVEIRGNWRTIEWFANVIEEVTPDTDFAVRGLMDRLDCSRRWPYYLHRVMEPFPHRAVFWFPVETVDGVIAAVEAGA
jgi:hypothetical protein